MASVKQHYDQVLAEVYTWMQGGFDDAKKRNAAFFETRNISPKLSKKVIDLGAGSGFQSIPLAELGFSVTAIDLNVALLDELNNNSQGLPITTIQDDMMNFQAHCDDSVELIICMTDTLIHLDSKKQVLCLCNKIFQSLEQGGQCIFTFRDLSHELTELDRFVPVKSDDHAVFTCFLEYEPDSVKVHDIVYKKINNEWVLQKSFYRKIKLSEKWLEEQLIAMGFTHVKSGVENGLVALSAIK